MLVFCIILSLSVFAYSQERVIIENRGDHYHVENFYLPETDVKRDTSQKYHRKKSVKKERYYIAKEKGKVFHRPSCRFGKKIKHKMIFKSRKKAIKAGLRPCRVCRP
ncbi:MAG: Ada metal-binding domain-containing protein [Persephonella sp.]|nr:Ada metal-binding domain-containing protein [Persephonella sp.]